jgi:DNA-binding CsgD family transcriptional regulator
MTDTGRVTVSTTMRVTRGKLNRLAHAGLDSFAYRERAIDNLRAVLPFDAAWWWSIDPASGLFTSGVFDPLPSDDGICGGVHSNESGLSDYNKFRVLARTTDKAGILSAATGGHVERSDRYRDLLTPMHYQHELRLALGDGSALWGGLALLRNSGTADFTPAQAHQVASLSQILTEGLRIGVALGAASVDSIPDGPGMLIVDDDLSIRTMTPNVEHWLEELSDGGRGLPEVIRSVVGLVEQLDNCDAPADHLPRARVRGASGRWLAIHASRTGDTGPYPAGIAVIIEEATPAEIAPLIMHAYGMSPREARVTSLVLRGLSTIEIAAELYLSPYTVQDHLKVIFAKAGVRSRRELVGRVFDQYHWPRYGTGTNPPEPDGSLAGSHDISTAQ